LADSADLGVVDSSGAAYGYEGLYCIDARDPAGGTVAASAAPAPQAPSVPPEPASEGADPAIDWPASVSDADPPRSSGSREACDLTEPLG